MMAGVPAVRAGLLGGAVSGVSRRALRARLRHHDRAGGRQPAHLDARPPGHRTQPADLRAGLQLPRHDDLSVRRLHPDSRQSRDRGSKDPLGCRARRLPHRRDPYDRHDLPRPRGGAADRRRGRLAAPQPPERAARHLGQHPARLRPAQAAALRARRAVHLPVRRRGSSDRLVAGELPHAVDGARDRTGGSRQARALLLGRRTGRALHRRRGCCGCSRPARCLPAWRRARSR